MPGKNDKKRREAAIEAFYRNDLARAKELGVEDYSAPITASSGNVSTTSRSRSDLDTKSSDWSKHNEESAKKGIVAVNEGKERGADFINKLTKATFTLANPTIATLLGLAGEIAGGYAGDYLGKKYDPINKYKINYGGLGSTVGGVLGNALPSVPYRTIWDDINSLSLSKNRLDFNKEDVLSRVIGKYDTGYKDLLTSGVVRGNMKAPIGSADQIKFNVKALRKLGANESDIENYASNNIDENVYNNLKPYFDKIYKVNTSNNTAGITLSREQSPLLSSYEEFIKDLAVRQHNRNLTYIGWHFNRVKGGEWFKNWKGHNMATFAKTGENPLEAGYVGDYAVQIANGSKYAKPAPSLGHFPEHPVTEYPMPYNHPDVTIYKARTGLFNNKKYFVRIPRKIVERDRMMYLDGHLPTKITSPSEIPEQPTYSTVPISNDIDMNLRYYPYFQNDEVYTDTLENNKYKLGGIHIKPSKRGTFTAAANAHGQSVQGFASKVLANKENYSSAMVKKANFARNASKWKHSLGGNVRPKAFLGSLLGTASGIVGMVNPVVGVALGAASKIASSYEQSRANKKAAEQQALQDATIKSNTEAESLNKHYADSANRQSEYERLFNTYAAGGVTGGNIPTITDGGSADHLGNNTFLLRGRSHETGGIGIRVGNKEIEAEGGEVVRNTGKSLEIFSAQNMGGIVPAKAVMRGDDPNKVFAYQENYKKKHKLKDDGSKMARLGKRINKLAAGGRWSTTNKDNQVRDVYTETGPQGQTYTWSFRRPGNNHVFNNGRLNNIPPVERSGVVETPLAKRADNTKKPTTPVVKTDGTKTSGSKSGTKPIVTNGKTDGTKDKAVTPKPKTDLTSKGDQSGKKNNIDTPIEGSDLPVDGSNPTEWTEVLPAFATWPQREISAKVRRLETAAEYDNDVRRNANRKAYFGYKGNGILFRNDNVDEDNYEFYKDFVNDVRTDQNTYVSERHRYPNTKMRDRNLRRYKPTYKYNLGGRAKKLLGDDIKFTSDFVYPTTISNPLGSVTTPVVNNTSSPITFNSTYKIPDKIVLDDKTKDAISKMESVNRLRLGIGGNNGGGLFPYLTKTDIVGGLAGLGVSIAQNAIAAKAANSYQELGDPVLAHASKLKTTYNIAPELANIERNRTRTLRDIAGNTISSAAALARMNNTNVNATDASNRLYGQKENIETELINKDILNRQQVDLANANVRNEFARYNNAIRNERAAMRSDAKISAIGAIGDFIQDMTNRNDQRYADSQNRIAVVAGSHNGSPSRYLEIGGDLDVRTLKSMYNAETNPQMKALLRRKLIEKGINV